MVIRRHSNIFTLRSANIKVSLVVVIVFLLLIKSVFRNPPQSHQEWLQLLQKQESLRNIEAQKWQKQLKNAIDHLRKVMIAFSFISSNYAMLIELNNV